MKKILAFVAPFILTGLFSNNLQAGSYYYGDSVGKGALPDTSTSGSLSSCQSNYFDYDYLDVDYLFNDYEEVSLDQGHGVSIGLSKTLTECTFLSLGGSWNSADGCYKDGESTDLDLWSFGAGIGLIFPITERVHLNGEVGGSYSFEDSGEEGEGGGYAGPTLRVGVTESLEVFASGIYYFGQDNSEGFDASVGTVLRITQGLGLKASWSYNEDEQAVRAGFRIAF